MRKNPTIPFDIFDHLVILVHFIVYQFRGWGHGILRNICWPGGRGLGCLGRGITLICNCSRTVDQRQMYTCCPEIQRDPGAAIQCVCELCVNFCAIFVRSLCDLCTLSVRFLCDLCKISVRFLCDLCTLSVRFLCDLFMYDLCTISVRFPCDLCMISVRSLSDFYATFV